MHLPGPILGILAGTLILGWLKATRYGLGEWLFIIAAAYVGYVIWHAAFKRTSLFKEE